MLGAANAAIQGAKEIAELVKKTNDIPLYEKIVTLQGQVVELATERLDLVSENQELKRKLDLKSQIRFDNPYFWQEGDEVPLCPKCYSGSGETLRIHLSHPSEDFGSIHGRRCCQCGYVYREGPRHMPFPSYTPRSDWG